MDREEISVTRIGVPETPGRTYEVRVGRNLLPGLLPALAREFPGRRPFLVTDANLEAAGHAAALRAGRELETFVIDPPGESSKTLATVEEIVGELDRLRFGRDALVVALGGGTVGDLAGFAAAIFKRGVPCVQLPTTTVAQADSAIGGKTGVDSPYSKNAYGVFHHPALVVMDVGALATLDERHYRAGLVESLKHALIADAQYLAFLEGSLDAVLARDHKALAHLAARNSALKGEVVFADPYEKNRRRALNYGHTLGHAVEQVSGYALLHGEAVALGIRGAGLIAERLGLCGPEPRRRAQALLARLGQPAALPAGLAPEALREALARDKKAVGAGARFVLLAELGRVHAPGGEYAQPVPGKLVDEVLEELRRP